jgi:hypothetical protein
MSMVIRATGSDAALGAQVTEGAAKGSRKNIDARDLTLDWNNGSYIDDKRKNARNQAMKIIGDAFDSDTSKSRKIQALEDERAGLAAQRTEMLSKIRDIDANEEQMREEYGVDADSQEQKDLELLKKYQRNKSGTAYEDFSEDEISRLKELQDTPLTEYQKNVLLLDNTKNGIDSDIQKVDAKLEAVNMNAVQAKNSQAASQDMLDAKDTAEQVVAAAERDIMLNVVDEAKETLDDKREESEEKAEKAEEKKEEKEAAAQKTKEQRDDEDIIKGDSDIDALELNSKVKGQSVDNVAEAQKQIEALMKKNNMINEDIKGIDIDLNF